MGIKNVKFKAKVKVNSKPICLTFNAEVGFFKRLDAIHELLEMPIVFVFSDKKGTW